MLQTIILGIVQGLSEFLPISSSGHLVLLQRIFGMPETGLLLEILLHVGSLVAVLAVFYHDIIEMLRHPFKSSAVRMLIVATVPALIVAVLFEKSLETLFGGWFLGISFLITSCALFASEWLAGRINVGARRKKDSLNDIRYGQALTVGIAQAVAIIPGISRSGSTIVAGIGTGITRQTAAKFSFLMGAIATLGSLILKMKDFLGAESAVFEGGWAAMLAGVLVSAVCSYLAIRWMLQLITRVSLKWFGLYTGLLGIIILCDQLFFGVVFARI